MGQMKYRVPRKISIEKGINEQLEALSIKMGTSASQIIERALVETWGMTIQHIKGEEPKEYSSPRYSKPRGPHKLTRMEGKP